MAVNWGNLHGGVIQFHDWLPIPSDVWPNGLSLSVATQGVPQMPGLNMNFAHVYVWYADYLDNMGPSAYLSYLDSLASAFDTYGIQAVYGNGNHFPHSLYPEWTDEGSLSFIGGTAPTSWYNSWFANQITANGLSGWDDELQNFWAPIIGVTSKHSSTIGYGLWNEPTTAQTTDAQLSTFYSHQGSHIRNMVGPNPVIFFMGRVGAVHGGEIVASAPTGVSNLGVEMHPYGDPTTEPISTARSVVGANGPVMMGEYNFDPNDAVFSPDNSSNTAAQSYLTNALTFFKNNNLASAIWELACDYEPFADDYQIALTSPAAGCTPWWYSQMLAQTIATVYGIQPPPMLNSLNITSVIQG